MGWIMIDVMLMISLTTNFNTASTVRTANSTSKWTGKQLPPNTTMSQTASSTVDTDISVGQGARKQTISTRENARYNLDHLRQQCPYADICVKKEVDKQRKSKNSCCLPCSCDPFCTTIGNCCFKNSTSNGLTCHAAYVEMTHSQQDDTIQFFMVDTCSNSENLTDCKAMDTYPWGSLYPVYDPSSGLIFFNEYCAECSGIKSYARWEMTINCETDAFSNNLFLRGLNGNECRIQFFPPRTVEIIELEKHICSNTLISSCNVSGLWATYDAKLEEACSRYYAPVTNFHGYLRYANKYCELCNEKEATQICSSPLLNINMRRTSSVGSLTALIDYKMISKIMDRPTLDDAVPIAEKQCGKHMVKHPSKTECRPVLCPSGFIRIDDTCEAISTIWLMDAYFIQLALTPSSNKSLPLSYLNDLSDKEKKNRDLWLDSRGIPLDTFRVFVEKIELENEIFVKKMIMQVGKKEYPLNIAKETESIRKSVAQIWNISLKGDIFSFSVEIDKFAHFIFNEFASPRYDIVAYTKDRTMVYEKKSIKKLFQTLHFPLSHELTGYAVLRKVNICEKVRLLATEWIGGFQEIQLDTSLTGSSSNKTLGDSEFDIYLDEYGTVVVEICVEDFNSRYSTHMTSGSLDIICKDHVWLNTLLSGLVHMSVMLYKLP